MTTLRSKLSEAERKEFDNVTYESIMAYEEVEKLRRLEAYMREEGFAPTAAAATKRLEQLGVAKRSEVMGACVTSTTQDKEVLSDLLAWQSQVQNTDAELMQQRQSHTTDLAADAAYAPVRKFKTNKPSPQSVTPTVPLPKVYQEAAQHAGQAPVQTKQDKVSSTIYFFLSHLCVLVHSHVGEDLASAK